MARTFSLAHLTLPGCPLHVFIETAARAGYDHVSLRMTKVSEDDRVYPLISDRSLRRRTGRLISDAGLSVLDVELLRLDRETEPEQFESLLEASAELGARSVIVQIPDPDRQRAVDRYRRLCDLARTYRLSAALEFVSWTETADLCSAAAIVRAADRTNGGILVDMLHFDRSGSELEDLERIPAAWFQFIHLCDAPRATPALTEGVIQAARSARLFPGDGELPIREVLRRIPAVPCSLEIPNAELLDKLGPDEFARRALASARSYLAAEQDQQTGSVMPARLPRAKTPDARTRATRGDGTWHDR
jgi:sugar phosphate isomerase/epimerase